MSTVTATSTVHCPFHPEPYLWRATKWPSLLGLASLIDDTVSYCVGDGGQCSWVGSAKLGVITSAGVDRMQPWEVKRAYERLISANATDVKTTQPRNYGPAPWES